MDTEIISETSEFENIEKNFNHGNQIGLSMTLAKKNPHKIEVSDDLDEHEESRFELKECPFIKSISNT